MLGESHFDLEILQMPECLKEIIFHHGMYSRFSQAPRLHSMNPYLFIFSKKNQQHFSQPFNHILTRIFILNKNKFIFYL